MLWTTWVGYHYHLPIDRDQLAELSLGQYIAMKDYLRS